ncbi:MAG: NAD-dependent epimerase/dehydratase family protein [Chloroflexaceae bacterium]|nr:NAD-dependent epimerase/dehydratase family protein [Chloroflexaceae bacterium]
MQILITGASGFLGHHLCQRLTQQGHDLVALNARMADLTHQGSLDSFNDRRYDLIFHLAAWTQAGDFCLYHAGEQWIINQQINTNVLAWWQQYQPQARLISIGTSCSYAPEDELVEEHYLRGLPIDSLFTYAMTKRMLYAGQLALHRQFGLQYLCLVPSTLYGAGYHMDGRQMHFIFDLIRKIIHARRTGEPVVLWGDGYQRRELILVDDFVSIMLHLVETQNNDLINIGAGEEFPIRHFAQLICEHVGYDFAAIQFDTSRYVGARSKCLRIDKLRRLVPDLHLTPLEEGLARTIDWFETAYDHKGD